MAREKQVEIAVVTRTYQGLEGHRNFAGTRFAVGRAQGDLKVITLARYNQLQASGLVRPLGEEDAKALPRARYAGGPTETDGEGTSVTLARNVRQRVRSKFKAEERGQETNPPPPKAIAPIGSQTGEGKPSSSSPGAQASDKSTSSSRGRRGASR